VNLTAPTDDRELTELLSRPTAPDVEAMAALDGDIVVLGAGGKMGPTLSLLARRASDEADVSRRVIAVSRFGNTSARELLESAGIETLSHDLLDADSVADLPDATNVILMAGKKFGTENRPAETRAANEGIPKLVAHRYAKSRIVAFSTGNVYPLADVNGRGPTETDAVAPIGAYAGSALTRERVLQTASRDTGTEMVILRLNYAVELRYGVLRDLADLLVQKEPIDLTMGYVNVIWQRDASAVALRALAHCATPPFVLNVTGRKHSVRRLAEALAARLQVEPVFVGEEAPTALLSDASRCHVMFGTPTLPLDTLLDWVADWVRRGGSSFGQPTHFQEREGRF